MFEFPRVLQNRELQRADELCAAIEENLGLRAIELRGLGEFRHQILDRSITVTAFVGRIAGSARRARGGRASWRWLAPDEWRRLPLSAAALRMIELLGGPAQSMASSRQARRNSSGVPASMGRLRVKAR
jgi:hypothetical protein